MGFVVAIDGPAGTGKGVITKLVAEDLGLIYIDTGATYRCVTLAIINNNIKLDEIDKIVKLLNRINIEFKIENNVQKVYLNNVDVTEEIRKESVNKLVSPVSAIKEVRQSMTAFQRDLAKGRDVIMEGRDIGTVVFPNADVKIYMDADIEERAKRRYIQSIENNINISYEEVLEHIKLRDESDKNKPIGALKVADDAIVINTTNKTIEETKEIIKKIIKEVKRSKSQ